MQQEGSFEAEEWNPSQIIQRFSNSRTLRSQLCRSTKIKISQTENLDSNSNELFLTISTRFVQQNRELRTVVRRAKEIDSVEQYLYNEYGGHIIPVLSVDLYFLHESSDHEKQHSIANTIQKVENYCNNIARDFYCSGDQKVFDLLFNPSNFNLQQSSSYEKVLSKAATLSRKYLNSIFARKELHTFTNPKALNLVECYECVKAFSADFASFFRILENSNIQIDLVDDIFSEFGEMCLSEDSHLLAPIHTSPYLDFSDMRQLERLSRMLQESKEAYNRWELLNEKVRELQGNVNKGMHEDMALLKKQQEKLIEWTASLSQQFAEIVEYGQGLTDRTASKFTNGKAYEYGQNLEISSVMEKLQTSRRKQQEEQENQKERLALGGDESVDTQQNLSNQGEQDTSGISNLKGKFMLNDCNDLKANKKGLDDRGSDEEQREDSLKDNPQKGNDTEASSSGFEEHGPQPGIVAID